jgi:hypothetical protein
MTLPGKIIENNYSAGCFKQEGEAKPKGKKA